MGNRTIDDLNYNVGNYVGTRTCMDAACSVNTLRSHTSYIINHKS